MDLQKKDYEISVWEDVIEYEIATQEEQIYRLDSITEEAIKQFKKDNNLPQDSIIKIIGQYFKEQQIAIIGSSHMTSPIKALEPELTENSNGEIELSFKMPMKYTDVFSGEKIDNNLIQLLTNERKIKLFYKGEWYDFIIKDSSENSSQGTISYVAKSLYFVELSKTGFEIELDEELENNQGTEEELAAQILSGTDWNLVKGHDNEQVQIEPLYKFKLSKQLSVYDIHDINKKIIIPAEEQIYAFYSQINDKTEKDLQIIWGESYITKEDGTIGIEYEKNMNGELVKYPTNLVLSDIITYSENGYPSFAYGYNTEGAFLSVAEGLRGEKLIKQQKSLFIDAIKEYVKVYEDNGKEIYGFSKTDFLTTENISNLVANGKYITSTSGWAADKNAKLDFIVDPPLEQIAEIRESGLSFTLANSNTGVMNTGFQTNLRQIASMQKGQEFVVGVRGKYLNNGAWMDLVLSSSDIEVVISPYKRETDGTFTLISAKDEYKNLQIKLTTEIPLTQTNIEEDSPESTKNSLKALKYYKGTYNGTNLSYSDLLKFDWGIFVLNNSNFPRMVKLFELNLTKAEKTLTTPEKYIILGTVPTAAARTHYYYYVPKEQKKIESIDDIKFYYEGYKQQNYKKVYNQNPFEKIRSIKGKESTRFNLLQEICETFETWIKFEVGHNSTGEIKLIDEYIKVEDLEEVKNTPLYTTTLGTEEKYRVPHGSEGFSYTPNIIDGNTYYTKTVKGDKNVTFRQYVGKDNYAGFKYGINLKSIERKIDSEKIVTKMIVKPNENEFGQNGFCSIARAKDNLSKENVIYNFDYFIRQLLVESGTVTNDLYAPIINDDTEEVLNGYIGYYTKMSKWNSNLEALSEEKSQLTSSKLKADAAQKAYKEGKEEAIALATDLKGVLKKNYNIDYDIFIKQPTNTDEYKELMANTFFKDSVYQIQNYEIKTKQFEELLVPLNKSIEEYKSRIEKAEQELTNLRKKKIILNNAFYSKYSRYIQEGSWMSEDYIDDNLYYLDSLNVMYNSVFPKVTYTIGVVELSSLPEYTNYTFNCGDKTYIEDTEFFGWVKSKDGNGYMPYQEEIVITEVKTNLEDPTKNVIKVQNYKDKFQSLFQRITATTQSIEYKEGGYDKVTNIFNSDGTMSQSYLQNSIANATLEITNSNNESVTFGRNGITSIDLSDPSQVIRITSGAIGLSVNGGKSFSTAITGHGINANQITTGNLDAGQVNIFSGDNMLFSWNKYGLNAYSHKTDSKEPGKNFLDLTSFVRFDQFGLYGVKGVDSNFYPAGEDTYEKSLELIRKSSYFGLIQDGFFLQSKGTTDSNANGYISISSKNDFQVYQKQGTQDIERVKIGRIKEGEAPIYGLKINDLNGNPSLISDSTGKLWLTDYLRIGPEYATETNDRARFGLVKKNVLGLGLNKILSIKDAKIMADLQLDADESLAFYDNGTALMKKAIISGGSKITGEVQIGNMTVDSIVGGIDAATETRIEITSSIGQYILVGQSNRVFTLKCHIYKGNKELTDISDYKFQWYKDNIEIPGAVFQSYTENNFSDPSALYKCEVTYGE